MWVQSRESYLLGLGRFSKDKGKEAQADFLMLGGPFAYLGYKEGKKLVVIHRRKVLE